MIDWSSLIFGDDDAGLAEAIRATFGVDADIRRFRAACRTWQEHRRNDPQYIGTLGRRGMTGEWSSASWEHWVRNRIEQIGGFEAQRQIGRHSGREIVVGELHVGFVGVPESDAQLDRLKQPGETVAASGVARSKIGMTTQNIKPIDRVAMRVVPEEEPS